MLMGAAARSLERPVGRYGLPNNAALRVEPRDQTTAVRELLARALKEVLDDPKAAHSSIERAANLLQLDGAPMADRYQTLETPGGLNPWQEQRAKVMLEDGLAGGCSIEAIAEACDLPLAQFSRAFQRTTGLSPLRWQRARRVERAKELLYSSRLSLAQIAYECGFADQSHLTRSFAAATGSSPGAWRRARRAV